MSTPPDQTHSQRGVFTHQQAIAAGWTAAALRHAVEAGDLLHPRRAAYALPVDPEAPDAAVLLAVRHSVAASLTRSEAVVSHAAAAFICRLPVVVPKPTACITVAGRGVRDRTGVHLHRAALPFGHRARSGPVTLTSPARTVVDCAREFGPATAVAMGDAGLRTGVLTRAALRDVVGQCANWPFIGRASELVDFVDDRSESPLESLSRWEMARHGVPAPTLQQVLLGRDGRFLARADFYWDEFGVVGEADGQVKYETRTDLRREKARQDRLAEHDLIVVRWGWSGGRDFAPVAARLRRKFSQGARRTRPREWRLG